MSKADQAHTTSRPPLAGAGPCPVAAIAAELALVIAAASNLQHLEKAEEGPSPKYVAALLWDRGDALEGIALTRKAESATGAALQLLLARSIVDDLAADLPDSTAIGGDTAHARAVRQADTALQSCLAVLVTLGANLPPHLLKHYLNPAADPHALVDEELGRAAA